MTPENPREWSSITIRGSNLKVDDTCSIFLSGYPAYILDCTNEEIRAVTPWVNGVVSLTARRDGADVATRTLYVGAVNDEEVSKSVIPGALNIKTSPDVDAETLAKRLALPMDEIKPLSSLPYGLQGWWSIRIPEGDEISLSRQFAQQPGIEYVGPEPTRQPHDIPNDPYYSSQWYLSQINTESAWAVSKGQGAKIAVIDTGFQTNHPDLAPHMLPGWNCDGGQDVGVLSGSAHGTETAGIAAAATNQNQPEGVAGVAWNGQIIPLRDDALVPGQSCDLNDGVVVLVGIALEVDADVLNMSIGFNGPYPLLCEEIRYVRGQGLVVVVSAGNVDSTNLLTPADCPEAVVVAASNPDDAKSSYSNYGSGVDISAPGGECSGGPSIEFFTLQLPPTYYGYDSILPCGTSFAAPLVAGVAALLAARGFAACEIEDTLKETAVATTWEDGAGRLDAGAALSYWPANVPIADPPSYVPNGTLLKNEFTGALYVVRNEIKYQIANWDDFDAMHVAGAINGREAVQCASYTDVGLVPVTPPDKTALQEFGSSDFYIINCRARMPAISYADYLSLFGWGYVDAYSTVPPGSVVPKFSVWPKEGLPDYYYPFCNLREVNASGVPYSANYIFCGSNPAYKFNIRGTQAAAPAYIQTRLYYSYGYIPGEFERRLLFPQLATGYSSTTDINKCINGDKTSLDIFSDVAETYMGTSPYEACASTSGSNNEPQPDNNPFDFNDDQLISILDVSTFSVRFGKIAKDPPEPFPRYEPRWDFNVDGLISILDVSKFSTSFGRRCSPGGDSPYAPEPDGPDTDMPTVGVAVDADALNTSANTATSLGSLEQCTAGSVTTLASGTSTGGNTGTTLNDTSQSFAPTAFASKAVAITTGAGAGQVRMITGNTSTQLTVTPAWAVVPDSTSAYEVQETILVDVTVSGIPAYDPGTMTQGLVAFGFNFAYDGSKLTVVGVNPNGNANTILASAGSRSAFDIIDGDGGNGPDTVEPIPSSSGDVRIDMADLSTNYDSGSGVMLRLVLLPTANGSSTLSVGDVVVGDAASAPYEVNLAGDSQIVIGGACP